MISHAPRLYLLGFVGIVLTVSSGCSELTDDPASSVSSDLTVDQRGGDVATLQAWIGPTVGRRFGANGPTLGDRVLDLAACAGTNCTVAAQSVLESPLLGQFTYDADRSGMCETIELRAVVAQSVLAQPSFAGVGFYVSSIGVAKASADIVRGQADAGAVVLRRGESARVIRFAAQGRCFGTGGNTGSLQTRSYAIHPFVEFEANGDTYRVWEASSDHLLGYARGGAFVRSFDRQIELLEP